MRDFRIMVDMFATLVLVEAVAKPVARNAGRFLLSRLDTRLGWIPDWLHKEQGQ